MSKHTTTGNYKASTNPNCDIFIPEPLGTEIINAISVSKPATNTSFAGAAKFTGVLDSYFLKLLAGDKCLHGDYAEIDNLELFLWRYARLGNNRIPAQVNNAITSFTKAREFVSAKPVYTKRLLLDTHKLICPKIKRPGFRRNNIRLGNPKNNKFAFYAPPPQNCTGLIHNLLEFLNSSEVNALTKALLFYLQFIMIHPFSDGNGRFARLLFINILQAEHGLLYAYLLTVYLKNINRGEYYSACRFYRSGKLDPLKNFYLKAVGWTCTACSFFHKLLHQYQQEIIGVSGQAETSALIESIIQVQQNDNQPTATYWQEHGRKGSSIIFINRPLLGILDQFDYYLKTELRKANHDFSQPAWPKPGSI